MRRGGSVLLVGGVRPVLRLGASPIEHVHTQTVASLFRDEDAPPAKPATAGEGLYQLFCAACHGADRTGVGVAPEELERLGRPYAQGEAGRGQGTGLGLSLVKAFARLHGGSMILESRLGEGTAATVRLPVAATAQAA